MQNRFDVVAGHLWQLFVKAAESAGSIAEMDLQDPLPQLTLVCSRVVKKAETAEKPVSWVGSDSSA